MFWWQVQWFVANVTVSGLIESSFGGGVPNHVYIAFNEGHNFIFQVVL